MLSYLFKQKNTFAALLTLLGSAIAPHSWHLRKPV